MGSSRMPWKRQESCIWTQCFTKNVIRYGLDQVMFHSSTMRESRYERPSPQLTSPVSTVTDLSPHFRFEKQIKTVQTWCFCTKKKNDWSWGLLMENLKYWLLIGRANLISTNGLSFTVCSQPFCSRMVTEDGSFKCVFFYVRFGQVEKKRMFFSFICISWCQSLRRR